jgi:hypothetical protein
MSQQIRSRRTHLSFVINLLILLILLVLPFCPVMGAVSESFGQEGSASGRSEFERLRRASQRVLFAIPNPPKIEWLVFDDPSINAGATFGEIVVSTGMLRFVRSDDELALILGHELAHITQGHVSQGAMNTSLLGLGSQVVNAIYPGIGLLTGQVGQLFLNRYNQDQERAADVVPAPWPFPATAHERGVRHSTAWMLGYAPIPRPPAVHAARGRRSGYLFSAVSASCSDDAVAAH